jgi:SAM-dependent methyltransferase
VHVRSRWPAGATKVAHMGRAALKYHQFRGLLGTGDLHPGGAPATARLLGWLAEQRAHRILEVGAGIGNTAARMAVLGWEVTALEPDPVLFGRLQKRLGGTARCEPLLAHHPAVPYDAVVAESVLFQLPLPQVFAHLRALLRPGGCVAFSEAVWKHGVTAAMSERWHDETERLFGIPVASRDPYNWQDWLALLRRAGFETAHAEMLPAGSAGHPPTADPSKALGAALRHPRLLLWRARYRVRKRALRMPPGVLESWLFLGTTPRIS